MKYLLSAVARLGKRVEGQIELDDLQVMRINLNGLGPIFHQLEGEGHVLPSSYGKEQLLSADLTARVLSAKFYSAVSEVTRTLKASGLDAVLLKGVDVAERFYPRYHWRLMRDVDILLPRDQQDDARELLLQTGFIEKSEHPGSRWKNHHHLQPLYHPEMGIWVELHKALFPHYSPFSQSRLFQPEYCFEHLTTQQAYGQSETFLAPELCFAFVACHWYANLIEDFGTLGLPRALVDCVFVADRSEKSMQILRSANCCLVEHRAISLMLDIVTRLPSEFTRSRPELRLPRGTILLRPLVGRYICNLKSGPAAFFSDVIGKAFESALLCRSQIQFWSSLLLTLLAAAGHSLKRRLAFKG